MEGNEKRRGAGCEVLISNSYPFLSITKKYGIEYSDVLVVADCLTRLDKGQPVHYDYARITNDMIALALDGQIMVDIIDAIVFQSAVRAGRVAFPRG